MARYIDADALADKIVNTLKRRDYASDSHTYACFKTFIEILDESPTADVVEVVKCSECKYNDDCARQMVHTTRDYVLEQNISTYNKVDFCSYGERKSNE